MTEQNATAYDSQDTEMLDEDVLEEELLEDEDGEDEFFDDDEWDDDERWEDEDEEWGDEDGDDGASATYKKVQGTTDDLNSVYHDGAAIVKELKGAYDDIKKLMDIKSLFKL